MKNESHHIVNDNDPLVARIASEKKINSQIEQHQREIRRLSSMLSMNTSITGTAIGSLMGYALGRESMSRIALASAFGVLGRKIGKDNPVTAVKKAQMLQKIDQHKRKIMQLKAKKSGYVSGVMSAEQLSNYQYECYEFTEPWLSFLGKPSTCFHAMVYGLPKSGKSIFCMKLADYLTRFGKVMYIAAEEGFGATLKEKIKKFTSGKGIRFASYRRYPEIREAISGHDFVFIDSVNYAGISEDQLEAIKEENPDISWITVHQATKQGQFRGSQEFAHNCDIVIKVEEGIAYQTGRFSPPSEMAVFNDL
jgi:predicted ATP-dependent serine protease